MTSTTSLQSFTRYESGQDPEGLKMFALCVFVDDQNGIAIGCHRECLWCPAIDLFLSIWSVEFQPPHILKLVKTM